MSEDVTIKMLEAYIKTFERWNDLYPITPQLIETLKSTLEIIDKQQKEIKDWFEIADNILRATNDYGNISIGYIPKYIEKQQKAIEELMKTCDLYKSASEHCVKNFSDTIKPNYISKDKIREKIKELEEQKEKLKYDGNRCFADYEQFCKNLKFFKEQINELLEEN